jgi:hypothetical protein
MVHAVKYNYAIANKIMPVSVCTRFDTWCTWFTCRSWVTWFMMSETMKLNQFINFFKHCSNPPFLMTYVILHRWYAGAGCIETYSWSSPFRNACFLINYKTVSWNVVKSFIHPAPVCEYDPFNLFYLQLARIFQQCSQQMSLLVSVFVCSSTG